MFKNLLFVLAASLILIACNTKTNNETEVKEITAQEFNDNAEAYLDQDVTITGTVSHVCKSAGKRLFIYQDNEEVTVQVETSEAVTQFEESLVGTQVTIVGTVKAFTLTEEDLAKRQKELTIAWEEAKAKAADTLNEVKEAIEENLEAVTEEVTDVATEGEFNEHPDHIKHSHEGAHADEVDFDFDGALKEIDVQRQQIKDSGKGFIVTGYYIEVKEVSEVAESTEETK